MKRKPLSYSRTLRETSNLPYSKRLRGATGRGCGCDYCIHSTFIVGKSFDEFIHILSKHGTFGGNECLIAFLRHFDAKICTQQVNYCFLINIV
jgi:hypothetical protein